MDQKLNFCSYLVMSWLWLILVSSALYFQFISCPSQTCSSSILASKTRGKCGIQVNWQRWSHVISYFSLIGKYVNQHRKCNYNLMWCYCCPLISHSSSLNQSYMIFLIQSMKQQAFQKNHLSHRTKILSIQNLKIQSAIVSKMQDWNLTGFFQYRQNVTRVMLAIYQILFQVLTVIFYQITILIFDNKIKLCEVFDHAISWINNQSIM